MNEEQKRIKAIIDEQIQLLKNNSKLKGKTDAQLWGDELRSRATKANMANPEYRAKWKEKQKLGGQNRSHNLEWREKNKLGSQLRSHNLEWRENVKLANQKTALNPEFREKKKLAVQKANNKQISCDGVIYESRITAALALAPETRLTNGSKSIWFENQMKKFPERYFYITQSE